MGRWIVWSSAAAILLLVSSQAKAAGDKPNRVAGYGAFTYGPIFPLPTELREDTTDGKMAEFSCKGLRLANFAALAVLTDNFHLGAYFQIARGRANLESEEPEPFATGYDIEDGRLTTGGFGAIAKLGFHPREKIFLAVEADIGFYFIQFKRWTEPVPGPNGGLIGLEVSPVLVSEFMLIDRSSFRFSIPIRAGAVFVPIARGKRAWATEYKWQQVAPFVTAGIGVGL